MVQHGDVPPSAVRYTPQLAVVLRPALLPRGSKAEVGSIPLVARHSRWDGQVPQYPRTAYVWVACLPASRAPLVRGCDL